MPLELDRRPKSPYWIIRGTLRGIRVEESTGTSDRRVAEEIRAKREAEILAQSIYGRRATATFAEAALSYLEARWIEAVHGAGHSAISAPRPRPDRPGRARPGRKEALPERLAIDTQSAVLRHRVGNPAPCRQSAAGARRRSFERPSTPPGRIRWLTIDEADRLIAACSDHLRPLVIFMLYTGARTGEALWLDWRDVDLDPRPCPVSEDQERRCPRRAAARPRVVAALANLTGTRGRSIPPPRWEALRATQARRRHIGRHPDQDGVQGRLQARWHC